MKKFCLELIILSTCVLFLLIIFCVVSFSYSVNPDYSQKISHLLWAHPLLVPPPGRYKILRTRADQVEVFWEGCCSPSRCVNGASVRRAPLQGWPWCRDSPWHHVWRGCLWWRKARILLSWLTKAEHMFPHAAIGFLLRGFKKARAWKQKRFPSIYCSPLSLILI